MSNAWGRPPQKKSWSDFKMIALWLFVFGAVIYLLFPNILSFMTGQNTDAAATLGDIVLPGDTTDSTSAANDLLTLPDVFDSLYQESEISVGYWIMYVGDGELKQLQLTTGAYDFFMSVLDKDIRTQEVPGTIPLLVATNGQLKKYLVSEQIFDIIHNLTDIAGRAGSI